ncbi:MAG: nuclear transport factor 2 family protein [Thermoleophilaceae bacterium]
MVAPGGILLSLMSQEDTPLSKREHADAMTAAVATRDFKALADLVDPEVELRSVLAGVEGGTYTGAEGLRTWVEDLHSTWDDYRGEIVEFHEVGDDQTLVIFRVRGTAKSSGVPLDSRLAQVWTWRDGKPWRAEAYTDPHEALKAVGLRE